MVVERLYRGVGSWEISFVFSSERRAVGTGGDGGGFGVSELSCGGHRYLVSCSMARVTEAWNRCIYHLPAPPFDPEDLYTHTAVKRRQPISWQDSKNVSM